MKRVYRYRAERDSDTDTRYRETGRGVKEKQQGSGSDTTKVTIMVPYAGDRPVLSSSGDHTVEKVTESENKRVRRMRTWGRHRLALLLIRI
ncbi:hypothetical protein Tco_0744465 [Tanacetum coccineum]